MHYIIINNNCFIIHLKTSEPYKTIKQSLVMFQVYLFYFRALVGRAGAWAQQRPIIFFLDASSILDLPKSLARDRA
jgi:hypothetical protein